MRLVNICELKPSDAKTITKSEWQTPDQFIDFLKKQGYDELGRGLNAYTFASNSSNAIVKVSRLNDICWINFAKYVEENSHPHYPKIRRLKLFGNRDPYGDTSEDNVPLDQRYFICFMERLQKIETAPKEKQQQLAAFMIETLKNLGVNYHIDLWKSYLFPVAFDKDRKNLDHNKIRGLTLKFKKQYPDFEKAIINLKLLRSGKCYWDLHPGNIMWRSSNSMWVLIDPFS